MTRIAILLPVLNRPSQAQRVVATIRQASAAAHRILFLCSPHDRRQIRAASACDAELLVVPWDLGPGDFAMKTNYGLACTDEEFVFCGADDLTFEDGWDTAALAVADEAGAGVIGTWDGANPVVKHGKHSTHSLVRRSYADEGGTLDGTGAIYCELYDHQCVDNELIEIAQARRAWAFAQHSRVLHHHPLYDRSASMDDTYRRALAHGKEDRVLFMQRRLAWQRDLRHARR